ncbi:ubiquitin-2 like Rad60 SUMO-like-domain-containing protein [Chlamydoabsidia padenii]|nr:ubiquitin-2 like Rad60 SUMO-like-domain-containing protein [Chlamydoabsidia padenii]
MTLMEPLSKAETTDTIPSSTDKATTSADEEVPLDKCRLTMLLVSGKRQVFDFDSHTTVDIAKTYILDHWPKDWADQLPSSIKNIEFVYLGKFLDNQSKLKDNGLLDGHATIIHLVIRQSIKKTNDDKKNMESTLCKCCIIL